MKARLRPQAYPTAHPQAERSAATWGARWMLAEDELGEDHPATQAAIGRQYAYAPPGRQGAPQRGSTSPSSVAWHRATQAQPGYYNRSYRRHQGA